MEKTVERPKKEDWDNLQVENIKVEKPGRDALFMGLGDVIFPGMLVISAITFLPQTGVALGSIPLSTFFGLLHLDPLLVGLGALFGGLVGYLGLMTQVAKGKPQAGLLRGGWGVKVNETIEAMRDQWKSMTGMAGMFVTTIFLGITIQPVWDKDEVRAFGEEGTTQGGYILLELALIGIFTFVIIWLARKKLELLIKGFIMFSLYFSLSLIHI